MKRESELFDVGSQPLQPRRIINGVDLVGGHDHGFVLKALTRGIVTGEELELAHDYIVIVQRLTSARGGHIDEVHQHPGPLEMTQESVAEALGRSVRSVYKAVTRIRAQLLDCVRREMTKEDRR